MKGRGLSSAPPPLLPTLAGVMGRASTVEVTSRKYKGIEDQSQKWGLSSSKSKKVGPLLFTKGSVQEVMLVHWFKDIEYLQQAHCSLYLRLSILCWEVDNARDLGTLFSNSCILKGVYLIFLTSSEVIFTFSFHWIFSGLSKELSTYGNYKWLSTMSFFLAVQKVTLRWSVTK